MDKKYTYLADELSRRGIRPSQQRLKILEYFHLHPTHPTVEMIYRDLKSRMPTLTKATIYNTLRLFVKENMVNEVHIEDNEVRYDLPAERHGHFKCVKCGAIYDFGIQIDAVPVSGLEAFEIESKDVYFRGVCGKCLAKNERRKKDA